MIIEEGLDHPDFIERHTNFQDGEGPITFEQYVEFLQDYTPEKVAPITGLSPEDIRAAVEIGARGRKTLSLWCMGINQRTVGTWLNNAIYNLHLLTGKICQPGNNPFSLTGQPSGLRSCARGGGGLATCSPCGRSVTNEQHRKEVAAVWGVDYTRMSDKVGYHTIELFRAVGDGRVKALLVLHQPGPLAAQPELGAGLV